MLAAALVAFPRDTPKLKAALVLVLVLVLALALVAFPRDILLPLDL